jgi:hypothetical protein
MNLSEASRRIERLEEEIDSLKRELHDFKIANQNEHEGIFRAVSAKPSHADLRRARE